MVAEKTPESSHDFMNDPIETIAMVFDFLSTMGFELRSSRLLGMCSYLLSDPTRPFR